MATRTPIEIAQLTARVLEGKNEGLTFAAISVREGISVGYAHILYVRGLHDIPKDAADEYRSKQLTRIRAQRAIVEEVLAARHVVVSNGHVVSFIEGTDENGNPIFGDEVPDDGPTLAAIDRLIKLDDQEARLLGLNAPVKTQSEVQGQISYQVTGIDPGDVV